MLPSNRRLFTAFLGLVGLFSLVAMIGWLFSQPSDCLLGLAILLIFFLFVCGRSYCNFLRRIFT